MDAGAATMTAGTTAAAAAAGSPTTRLTAAQAIRSFYESLAFQAAGWGLPTRVTRWGLAFAGYGTGRLHSVTIKAYAGRRGVASGPGKMLPRISLNVYAFDPPQSRCRLWSDHYGFDRAHRWRQSTEDQLEITCVLQELASLGGWLAHWARARDLHAPNLLPPCPVPLLGGPFSAERLLSSDYEWSIAGDQEYKARPYRGSGRVLVIGKRSVAGELSR